MGLAVDPYSAIIVIVVRVSDDDRTTRTRVIFKPVTVRGFFLGHPEFAAKLAPAVVQAAALAEGLEFLLPASRLRVNDHSYNASV